MDRKAMDRKAMDRKGMNRKAMDRKAMDRKGELCSAPMEGRLAWLGIQTSTDSKAKTSR
jgi:hypothetical protein